MFCPHELFHSPHLPLLPLAYIDPGTGSYMLQLLIGGAIGGLYLVKVHWRRLVSMFSKRPAEKGDGGDSD